MMMQSRIAIVVCVHALCARRAVREGLRSPPRKTMAKGVAWFVVAVLCFSLCELASEEDYCSGMVYKLSM